MAIDLSQFIHSFLEESFEGLDVMESGLLTLESGDPETINAIFRAAHTIKGGAGTFGFAKITEFTHLVETLLDEMRDGRRAITQNDAELLLDAVDCIRLLLQAAKENRDCDDDKIGVTTTRLQQTLSESSQVPEPMLQEAPCEPERSCVNWLIRFVPHHHLLQTGNDPMLLFAALADLGALTIVANAEQLPSLLDMDPEELYLSWQLTLIGACSENDIREIFEWVEDECDLTISQGESQDQEQPVIAERSDDGAEAVMADVAQGIAMVAEGQDDAAATMSAAPAPANTATRQAESPQIKTKMEASSIRVGVDKVDNLINLVGELVITQSMLSELGNNFDLSKLERLTVGLEQLLQNTRELQESVMRIRMLPISFAFNRFPRLVHDLSVKTGKSIALQIKGEQTELDKTVMEQIGDPLLHLVRNAVDHGIESTAIRQANGKPEQGVVSLAAYHQGGNIIIEISDDGAGINQTVVYDKAVEKGLIEPGASLSEQQIFDLIFEPGFSTAKQLSDISGRGVGMDVVKKNIQSLGGRIQVESVLGQGSTFRVNLPLTLAILDGQLVKVGTETFIIPLISIVESLQTQTEFIHRASGDMILYRLREDNVPVIPIYELFNLSADATDIEHALLVVVEADGQKVGLMVDDLLAQQQVVIKSLEDNYQHVAGISGATILGDGSVALILDVPGMIQTAMQRAEYVRMQRIPRAQQQSQRVGV